MKSPEFLKVMPGDIGRVGALGALILALIRYVTALPGEANGRRVVDGETWWRGSHDDIGRMLGGTHRKAVGRALVKLEAAGELLARPSKHYDDRAKEYRIPGQPLDESGQRPYQPLDESSQSSGRNRPLSLASSGQSDSPKAANLPIPLENLEEHSVGKKGASEGGTRLPEGWMPSQSVIETMRAECPHVALQAEHTKFVDYWIAKAGKDACKVDWNATWRNWIRRAGESAHPSGAARGQATAYEIKKARNAAVFNELANAPAAKEVAR